LKIQELEIQTLACKIQKSRFSLTNMKNSRFNLLNIEIWKFGNSRFSLPNIENSGFLKWYYDQKNHFLFSSDFESVLA